MAAIIQLLLLACTVWLAHAAGEPCTEAGKRSCSNCATVSLCDDSTLTESLSGCSVGQLCDDSAGVPACYLLASAPSGAQCKCKKNGKMADPFDPSWYVLCMGTSQYSIKCPDNQVFEEATGNCIIAPTTEPTTTMTPLECGAVPGPAVVPETGCKSYFACIPLDPTDPTTLSPTEVQQCPECQLYDTSVGNCVDQTFTCEGKGDGAIADTLSCTIYHTCIGGTELGEVINCASDQIFDGETGKCIDGVITDPAIKAMCPPVSQCVDETTICLDTSSTTTPSSSSAISKASSDPTSSASSGTSSDPSAPGSSSSSSSPPPPPSSPPPSSPPPSSPAPSSPPPPPLSSSSPSPSSISITSATAIAATTSSGIPDCSVDGGQPFPGDCTKYYYCIGGKPVLQKCPGITLFDSATNLCVLPGDATGCN